MGKVSCGIKGSFIKNQNKTKTKTKKLNAKDAKMKSKVAKENQNKILALVTLCAFAFPFLRSLRYLLALAFRFCLLDLFKHDKTAAPAAAPFPSLPSAKAARSPPRRTCLRQRSPRARQRLLAQACRHKPPSAHGRSPRETA